MIGAINFLFAVVIALASLQAKAADDCTRILSGPKISDGTQGLIAYLGALLEQQVIGDDHLVSLVDGIEKGVITNPISEEETLVSSPSQVHREEIQEYLSGTSLNRKLLVEWATSAVKEKSRIHSRREETRAQTEVLHQQMIFHRIEPGEFMMGTDKKVLVKITKPYEMMSTEVTQRHWAMIMGENPSFYKEGEDSMMIEIGGRGIKMQPDHPVEAVSWDDVQTFLVKLNEVSQRDDVELKKLIPDNQSGHRYRLPTEAEWEFVRRTRGTAKEDFPFGNDGSILKEYGWHGENAGGTTHPVAQLKPLIVGGKEFYDMLGNVWEWVSDLFGADLKGGIDPQGPKAGDSYAIRGSAFPLNMCEHRFHDRMPRTATLRSCAVGLRLVRVGP
jgi:formylglycine-generating enzyme required for sulfatase activity